MKNRDFLIGVILLIVIGNAVGFLLDYLKEEKLNSNTNTTHGIYNREIKSAYSGSVWVFDYVVDLNEYSIIEHVLKTNLQKGDTVLIEYSKEDPSVARVIDFRYMQKFKADKNKTENN